MKEARGNLWTYPAEKRVITTNGFVKNNGECVMGRGCAREAAKKYPELPKLLGSYIKTTGNYPQMLPHDLVSFPTKHVWWEQSDPALIVNSAKRLAMWADNYGWTSIVMPRPGCGNGHLNWDDIKPLLEPILDDRFTVITY